MRYTEFLRIEKLKRMLNIVAYGSLVLDFSIAVVILVSFNLYSKHLDEIQYFLNVALTAVVLVTSVLLVSLAYLYHYEKVLSHLASFSSLLTGRKNGKNRQ